MTEVPPIIHDQANHRFYIALNGEVASLTYDLRFEASSGDLQRVVDFTHTFVPPDYRNKGLAEALVRSGLRWARDNQYTIKSSCWYAARFLTVNPA